MVRWCGAQLDQKARVAEDGVVIQELLDDVVDRADQERAAWIALALKIVAPAGSPTTLAANHVHHRVVRGIDEITGLLGCFGDKAVCVDPELQRRGVVPILAPGLAVEARHRLEVGVLATDDCQRQR